jgi:hypothetical protein
VVIDVVNDNKDLRLAGHGGPNVYPIVVATGPKVFNSDWCFGQELSLENSIFGRATDS